MKIFFILLMYIVGLILTDVDLIFLTIGLLLFILFLSFKLKNNKKILIIGLSLFAIGVLQNNLHFKANNIDNQIAFVTKKSKNYSIIKIKTNEYITYDLKEARLFDIYKLSGRIIPLDIHKLESSFDFKKYLNHNNVFSQLIINKERKIVQNPINTYKYEEKILNKIKSNETKALVESLLFGIQEDDIREISSKLLIQSLLGTSGFFLTGLLYGITKIFSYFMYKKDAKIFSFIFYCPFLLFNIHRFTVIRVGIFFLFNIICENLNINLDSFTKKTGLYLFFILLNRKLIYSQSFYIPLLISIFLNFSYLYLKSENHIFTNLKRKILIILILIPFILKNNNSINFLSIIFTFVFQCWFKFLFGLSFLIFYGIYFSFFDFIFIKTYDFLNLLEIKYLNFNLPGFNSFGFLIYYIFLIIFIYFKEINYKQVYKKWLIVCASSFLIYLLPIKNEFTNKISFINVGQGDSTLIRVRNKAILIDTGGNVKYDIANNCLIPYLRKERIYKLDAVFITHYDYDHYGALANLRKYFIVDEVFDYNSIFPIVKCGIKFENLNTFWNKKTEDENSKSLVLNFTFSNKKYLLMGDAPSTVEEKIIKKYSIKCDVLKLGHHGSKESSCIDFLKCVQPKLAIISCGYKNKFHHPNKETLARLNSLKIPYRRTDLESTISYEFLAN